MRADFPIKFPSEADQIAREAAEFQKLSPSERLAAIFDLMASSAALLAESPNREYAARRREEEEAEHRKAIRELLARHGTYALIEGPEVAAETKSAGRASSP